MNRKKPAIRKEVAKLAFTLEKMLGLPERPAIPPDPLEMLIATVLSQNTNDLNSHRAYKNLRTKFPTWADAARSPARSIASAIRTGGMADQKAKRIKQILRNIVDMFGDYKLDALRLESDREVMERLLRFDGVGVKTAACVLLFSLRRDLFPVDTHIHRILGRLRLSSGAKTPEETFNRMKDMIPANKAHSLHTNLIRFGRKICRAKNPLCGECPLSDKCRYELKLKRISESSGGKGSRRDADFMLLDNV